MNPAPIVAGLGLAGTLGAPFCVARAIAVGGQIVRVVFSSEPRHASPAAINDGRNPANYTMEITLGQGDGPRCVGVLPGVVEWPAFGLQANTEFALDVQWDRELVIGMTYLVTVKPAVVSASSVLIGFPYSSAFVGAARPRRTRQIRRRVGIVDLASDPFSPGITVDSAGDWASHDGLPSTRKRILRRAMTPKNSFACLPGYGLGYDFKRPATTPMLTTLKTDLAQGIKLEPDVAASQTKVVMDARGLLAMTIQAKTTDGQDLTVTAQATQNGGITT